jgi:multicomponent K+:H+ antiporter subunit E/multicomponent Na+:H+ antiporter subunit E
MKRLGVWFVFLTAVYLLMLASVELWDLAQGVLIATVLLVAFRSFMFGGRPAPLPNLLRRLFALIPFTLAVLRDIWVRTWNVVLVVLRLRPLQCPGIVTVPIGERTPNGVAVSALATTLSPGSFLVDVDWERRVMLLHVIDASDPDVVREEQRALYQDYQRHVAP